MGHALAGRFFPVFNDDLLCLAIQRSRIEEVNSEDVGVAPDIKIPY